MERAKILVAGSLNYDVFLKIPSMPRLGETCPAESAVLSGGGKGANQAVQCAKLGLETWMLGSVGQDAMGDFLLDGLERYGVKTELIKRSRLATGLSPVHVLPEGKGFGTIFHGANDDVLPADIDRLVPLFPQAFALLLQLEIPLETVAYAAKLANQAGVPVILNAAPAAPLPPEVLRGCHTFMANEVEASFYTNGPVDSPADALERIVPFCREYGVRAVFTLGSQGAVACDGAEARFIPPLPARAVESTGAGDSFAGGYVKALWDGKDFFQAASFAARCGAFTVGRAGCQNAMPTLDEIRCFPEN